MKRKHRTRNHSRMRLAVMLLLILALPLTFVDLTHPSTPQNVRAQASPCGGNIIQNGGFETGFFPPWVKLNLIPFSPFIQTLLVHSGAYAYENTAPGVAGLYVELSHCAAVVVPWGDHFQISFLLHLNPGTLFAQTSATIDYYNDTLWNHAQMIYRWTTDSGLLDPCPGFNSTASVTFCTFNVPPDMWITKTPNPGVDFEVGSGGFHLDGPSNHYYFNSLIIFNPANYGGPEPTVYLDDIALNAVGPLVPPPITGGCAWSNPNSGFEDGTFNPWAIDMSDPFSTGAALSLTPFNAIGTYSGKFSWNVGAPTSGLPFGEGFLDLTGFPTFAPPASTTDTISFNVALVQNVNATFSVEAKYTNQAGSDVVFVFAVQASSRPIPLDNVAFPGYTRRMFNVTLDPGATWNASPPVSFFSFRPAAYISIAGLRWKSFLFSANGDEALNIPQQQTPPVDVRFDNVQVCLTPTFPLTTTTSRFMNGTVTLSTTTVTNLITTSLTGTTSNNTFTGISFISNTTHTNPFTTQASSTTNSKILNTTSIVFGNTTFVSTTFVGQLGYWGILPIVLLFFMCVMSTVSVDRSFFGFLMGMMLGANAVNYVVSLASLQNFYPSMYWLELSVLVLIAAGGVLHRRGQG
jgi:hypothetical protein